MKHRSKRTILIGAAAALAVAGGGVAYAATSGDDHNDTLLRDAAQRLNVSPGELRSALEGAVGDQLDQAVKDGHLTREQADQIKQGIQEHGLPFGGPGGPDGHGPKGGPGMNDMFGGPGHDPLDAGLKAVADYLGISRDAVLKQLADGKSLAQVAKAEGKSVEGLEQTLVDESKTQLDKAVEDKKLTAEQRDQILKEVKEHTAFLVNGRVPGPLGALGGFGHGGPGRQHP